VALELRQRDRAFNNYLSVLIGEAEEGATSVQSTFDAIQPPDAASDNLRDQLDELLQQAVSLLGEVRIAVRREDRQGMLDQAEPLKKLSDDLDLFVEAHS